jgi:hypothetical protein
MNHNVTLAIVAVVAAMTLTAVAFAIPQQALAYKHHNNHNNHKNSIKVDQQINQQNSCSSPLPQRELLTTVGQLPFTDCQNFGDNSADIHAR